MINPEAIDFLVAVNIFIQSCILRRSNTVIADVLSNIFSGLFSETDVQ